MATIQIAQARDEAGAVSALTLAFSSDPMARWSLPDPAIYLSVFADIVKAFGGAAFSNKTAYVARNYTGAALWLPPGARSDEELLKRLFDEHTGGSVKRDMPGIFEQMEKYHPAEPHWYLPMIGVDPAHQGAGTGSALLAESLRAIDREGGLAYLESSNPRNIPLYERHGFEVIGEIRSGSSPVVRPMLRKARRI